MRTYSAVLLWLLVAGCASAPPPAPPVVAPQPAAPQPEAPKKTPVASKPVASQPVAPKPKPVQAAALKPATPPVTASKAAAPRPAAAPALDLDALKARLKATSAIGVFTKISLKGKVDDLMTQFREHYQGKSKPTLAELRQSYDLLMMKVLTLLQDGDPPLAKAVVSSREAIWSLLANEKTFAALQT